MTPHDQIRETLAQMFVAIIRDWKRLLFIYMIWALAEYGLEVEAERKWAGA